MDPMTASAAPATDLSVLVCTFNRRKDLAGMLESALAQRTDDFSFEILVVDNNSTDGTGQLVQDLIQAGHPNLRYAFEPRQGKGFALNTGLDQIRGTIFAIGDDDLVFPPDYLAALMRAFRANPHAACVGGKVLPLWPGPVPSWLTKTHWAAIAMADYGEEAIVTSSARPLCLLAGAFRADAVRAVGGYHRELAVSARRIGGTEDVDLLRRLYDRGEVGLYWPEAVVYHKVESGRVRKRYHRRWHTQHGASYAIMRDPEVEGGRWRILGIPAHLLRQAAVDVLTWAYQSLRLRLDAAFERELRVRFALGYAAERLRHRWQGAGPGDLEND